MKEIIPKDYLNPLFTARILKDRLYEPKLKIATINDLDPKKLKSQGIRALIFDIDNTIFYHNDTKIHPPIETSFRALTETFPSSIITNTENPRRREELQSYFTKNYPQSKITVIPSTRKKPAEEPYEKALETLNTRPEQTAIIGDNPFTDIAGANRKHIFSILVDPLDTRTEPRHFKIMRLIHKALRAGKGAGYKNK